MGMRGPDVSLAGLPESAMASHARTTIGDHRQVSDAPRWASRRRWRGIVSAHVKILEKGNDVSQRRTFLQRLAAQGVAIPAAYFAVQRDARAHQAGDVYDTAPATAGHSHIVREFAEPYIELIRLLRQATEIEHALMVQYLYGAFSVKPYYSGIVGSGLPNPNELLGVAAMEMQHLRDVNALLIALGAGPNLMRQGFPFDPEVYPFEF